MFRIKQIEEWGVNFAAILGIKDWEEFPELVDKKGVEYVLWKIGIKFDSICFLNQQHTNQIVILDNTPQSKLEIIKEPADGLITLKPGILLCITVADCVPIILFDPKLRILGLVHAGREGTRKKIAIHSVELFINKFGSKPIDIKVYIGPSIGPCCYYLSQDLLIECTRDGLVNTERGTVDLWRSNYNQMLSCGINKGNIIIAGECTFCSNTFFSYRRGDRKKRNYVVAMM